MINRYHTNSKMRRHRLQRRQSFGGMKAMALLIVLLLSASCSVTSTGENQVSSRAQTRWDALLGGDYDTAYEFLAPGYRSSVSRVDFEIDWRSRRVNYESAQYKSHECDGDACVVKIFIGFSVPQPVPGLSEFKSTRMLEETWIMSGGQWWFLPEK